ncbi:MAG: SIMPL domain-containing protein [Calditrichia bacterium]
MFAENKDNHFFLSISIIIAMGVLGHFIGKAVIQFKQFDRTVTVKGLSEREYPADIVIWPIQFTAAGNNLDAIYNELETNSATIRNFLTRAGIQSDEITISTPSIVDKSAQQYGNEPQYGFRFVASQIVTVYSKNIGNVRQVMGRLSELGKQGIVLTGENYATQTEYLFTRLNEVKPEMIEEATKKAREVAEKFARDSQSKLGKIKTASQGQFSISSRDKNNPHIKKIRVVSTVTYYLSD